MKLVIDAVTTPLLHARLSEASSYRERAAILRSLAEAALRESGSSTGKTAYPATPSAALPSHGEYPVASPGQRELPRRVETDTAPSLRSAAPSGVSEGDVAQAFDVDGISEAFGAFG
ncbi:hypothetical protein [Paraburkholderia dilworthii]|uniref:hypothetical protein n=1 Tax=Paraburkholderia dilworthii TaxID=948106 RepID=UPI00126828D9|nr:hypothetical protein [Paraburkholderia dilworthii]